MLVTGIILIPTAIATPAVQDLVDLRSVINSAASAIGDPNNPNRGFGFNLFGGSGQMGTADLVNNITNTILKGKFQLDTNRTAWLLPDNFANTSIPINSTMPTQATPTLPITASLALPSVLPSMTPTLDNLTVDLTTPYMDYVQAIPNLSSSLTTLGRSFHREMNSPVAEAITGLQQTLTTLQTAMLESDLISAQAILRTIRASNSLESASTAWSRFLNLPGGGSDDDDAGSASPSPTSNTPGILGRAELQRPPPKDGKFYTHLELWNRSEPRVKMPMKEKPKSYGGGVVVQAEDKRATTTAAAAAAAAAAEKARVGRPFVV
ncbi:hypothetical protein G6011_08371 [Alternaria panax]|uniref:Uncharacterized protein n=1 Tax=Alternaria panax TaxID=48097 RepID=A0AAD4FHS2_9PLEO|nr:hypothetical protein G6011_08371 [Alternaria panax]